jgi:hypothetical protein
MRPVHPHGLSHEPSLGHGTPKNLWLERVGWGCDGKDKRLLVTRACEDHDTGKLELSTEVNVPQRGVPSGRQRGRRVAVSVCLSVGHRVADREGQTRAVGQMEGTSKSWGAIASRSNIK